MAFYQVSSTELRNRTEQLSSLISKFTSVKDELMGNEAELMSMWEGQAKEAFHEAFMRDESQMEAFVDVINSYIRVMGTIADRYDAAEAGNINIAANRTY